MENLGGKSKKSLMKFQDPGIVKWNHKATDDRLISVEKAKFFMTSEEHWMVFQFLEIFSNDQVTWNCLDNSSSFHFSILIALEKVSVKIITVNCQL